jgi:serine/threonine-protein kinase
MNKTDVDPMQIDHYQIVRGLGKGGMGEVFLAFDPSCGRNVALKRIRQEMKSNRTLQERFLREARIASQLTHPSIIPIYTICQKGEETYYTMPYVEGETLKQILKSAYDEEKEGEVKHPIGSSIPTLMRIFLNVCQAIAYSHSKGILHRDIKPDNIIVGKYGEVLILDWGLADFAGETKEFQLVEKKAPPEPDLTKPGKVPGTLSYLAPERITGAASTFTTDIYSLTVILYQILTLRLPFQRASIQSFRKTMHLEQFTYPQEIAPYRDIPQHLADIAKRGLQFDPALRFQSVEEIIAEVESYIEGRPEWIPAAELHVDRKEDWEFQENILLAKHLAITRIPTVMEWVSLMISRMSFSGNTKIKAKIQLKENGNGIGFLLNIPEADERKGFEEGYCLWVGSEIKPGCKLFRSNVEVLDIPGVCFKMNVWHQVQIEKVDNHLRFYLDGILQFHYISHIPMGGTHVGVLYRDADFEMPQIEVSIGSQNVMVNCLAVPDAFLADKNYQKALSEYRRIGSSFMGRAEGREALFRAGITLLEEAGTVKKNQEKQKLYALALDEFSKLRFTPGAPLEYLGKALVYKAIGDIDEEIKCLELCVRKYPKHPLLKVLSEHITFRLHEASLHDRFAAYHFALLSARHLPHIFRSEDSQHLLSNLVQNLEPLPFILPFEEKIGAPLLHLAVQLSFWLAKPIPLMEIIESCPDPLISANAFYCMLHLGHTDWVKDNLHFLQSKEESELLGAILTLHQKGLKAALEEFRAVAAFPLSSSALRCAGYLLRAAKETEADVEDISALFSKIPQSERLYIDASLVRLDLLNNCWKRAQSSLEGYPTELLADEKLPLYVPFGCWLWNQEGKEIALSHFSGAMDNPYPPTTALLSYFLRKKIDEKAPLFFWEKVELLRSLYLFYHCAKQSEKKGLYLKRLKKELKRAASLHLQF